MYPTIGMMQRHRARLHRFGRVLALQFHLNLAILSYFVDTRWEEVLTEEGALVSQPVHLITITVCILLPHISIIEFVSRT